MSTEQQNRTQDVVVREGYAHATKTLRERYAGEARDLQTEYVRANGFPDWSPPLTAEQKAEKQLEDLVKEHPHLEDVLRKRYGLDGDEAFPDDSDSRRADDGL